MLLHFTPGNWFFIFLALAITAWLQIAGVKNQNMGPHQPVSAAAAFSFFKK